MFFTGFLTGFAKQAQASIAERNKEIRESIDETLKEKAEEVEKDRILKKKLRTEMKERSAMFTTAMDTDMEGLQLTVGQQLAIIGDVKTYDRFIADIAEYREIDSPKAKQAIVERIKKRFGGKMNVDPNMSLDQAIEASTQLDEITMPTAVIEKTAFGIPSNIQQRAIERFKGKMPKELTGTRVKEPVVGKYQGLADVQDVTQSESNKLVKTFFESAVSDVFTEASGTAGKQGLFFANRKKAAELVAVVRVVDVLIDVEVRAVAVDALAHVICQGAHGQQVLGAVERHAVLEGQSLFGEDLLGDRSQTGGLGPAQQPALSIALAHWAPPAPTAVGT